MKKGMRRVVSFVNILTATMPTNCTGALLYGIRAYIVLERSEHRP